jgi:hypothetical protein
MFALLKSLPRIRTMITPLQRNCGCLEAIAARYHDMPIRSALMNAPLSVSSAQSNIGLKIQWQQV